MATNEKESVGQRITRLREERGLSISALSILLSGSKTDAKGREVPRNRDTLWRWESDRVEPTPRMLRKLAEALDVAPTDIDPDYKLTKRAAPYHLKLKRRENQPGEVDISLRALVPSAVAQRIVSLVTPYVEESK